MVYIQLKRNIFLIPKIFLLVCGCIFFGKISSTLKLIPWLAKLTGHKPGHKSPVEDVNFTMVEPSVEPLLPLHGVLLLVLVSSVPGSDYLFARNAIRETWGTSNECRSTSDSRCPWSAVFLLGKSYQNSLDSQIKDEARAFNDILVGNFNDTYINLVVKLFMGFAWASKVNCRFVLKADDDIYVHVPKLLSFLHHAPSRLYAGHVHTEVGVKRDPDERNPLPPGSSFNERYYPPYCLGAFYVLSRSIIPDMLKAVKRWRPWPIEDTYIGVLARDVGVSPIDVNGFVLTVRASRNLPSFTECQWACTIAIGHRLTPSHLHLIHNKFENMPSFNSSTCPANTCSNDTESDSSFLFLVYTLIFTAIFLAAFVFLKKQRLTLNKLWFIGKSKYLDITSNTTNGF